MNGYEELDVIGSGAFGVVTRCRDRATGEHVAIKTMKARYHNFEQCLDLKEVKSLRKVKHENIVRLLKIFKDNDRFSMVFELLEHSLLKTIQDHVGPFAEAEVKDIIFQSLEGLAFLHRSGFFHRDIKPENLLWKGKTLKIADFGLAREIRSLPPFTHYISTRWYRAPEIILKDNYNSPVDIWALGCIMAELYIGKPLFPGTSEIDQLYKITGVLGTPKPTEWAGAARLASRSGIKFNGTQGIPLAQAVPGASPEALELLSMMLTYDPIKRGTAASLLQSDYFTKQSIAKPLPHMNPIAPASPKKRTNPILQKEHSTRAPKDAPLKFHPVHRNIALKMATNQFSSVPRDGTKSAFPELRFDPSDLFDELF